MKKKNIFNDIKVFKNKIYRDKRGHFKELLIEKYLRKRFPFVVMSYSKQNVIRGLHLQLNKSQGKYLSVIKGKIFDVSVDLRKNSKNFGKYFSIILSNSVYNSIFIPPGYAHGFCSLDKENYITYSCTNYRDIKSEIGIAFNDKEIGIKWPIKEKNAILSKKDLLNISLKEFINKIK